jgi:hypothetical protein
MLRMLSFWAEVVDGQLGGQLVPQRHVAPGVMMVLLFSKHLLQRQRAGVNRVVTLENCCLFEAAVSSVHG